MSDWDAIERGANVLLRTLLTLAGSQPGRPAARTAVLAEPGGARYRR